MRKFSLPCSDVRLCDIYIYMCVCVCVCVCACESKYGSEYDSIKKGEKQ